MEILHLPDGSEGMSPHNHLPQGLLSAIFQEVLPVEVLTVDDRMEHCEGVKPVTVGEHEALKGIPTDWPEVLGYNKVIAKPEAEVPVTVEASGNTTTNCGRISQTG